jgi:hypothetical protein
VNLIQRKLAAVLLISKTNGHPDPLENLEHRRTVLKPGFQLFSSFKDPVRPGRPLECEQTAPLGKSYSKQALSGAKLPIREVQQIVVLKMPFSQNRGFQNVQLQAKAGNVLDFDLDFGFYAQ